MKWFINKFEKKGKIQERKRENWYQFISTYPHFDSHLFPTHKLQRSGTRQYVGLCIDLVSHLIEIERLEIDELTIVGILNELRFSHQSRFENAWIEME